MKRLLIIALSLVGMATTSAKDKIEATIGADLVSQYIWRGQNLGDFSLQPTLGVGYKGISLSAWGSVGISNSSNTKELDLTLKYEHKGFSVGVTDYWFSEGSYFQYHAHKTTHVWEGFVGYDFGFLSATWYTNFAGNDGLNGSDKRAYSSYFELSAPFRLAKLDWMGTVGIVPWRDCWHCALAYDELRHQRLCLHQRFAPSHEELPHQAEVPPARLCRSDLQSLFGQVLFHLRNCILA